MVVGRQSMSDMGGRQLHGDKETVRRPVDGQIPVVDLGWRLLTEQEMMVGRR
jgi:hypothetical protein